MKFQRSIKQQTVLLFASFTLLLSIVYTLFTVFFAYIVEDEVIDRLLANESVYLRQQFSLTGELPISRLGFMRLYANSQELPDFIAKALLEQPNATEVFTQDSNHFHLTKLHFGEDQAGRHNSIDAILVANVTELLSVRNLSGNLMVVMGVALCVVMLLAIWLAYRIAGVATHPILRLTQELLTQQTSGQPLSLRSKNSFNELGYLAASIENSWNNLNAALQRESDFTRDVSHELRTPLTVVKNTLALIEQREWQTEDKNQLDQAVNQMHMTVAVLLALARQESMETTRLKLRPIFESCILALHQELADRGFCVALNIQDDLEVEGNHSLIILLVNNLIENAMQHASNVSLTISRQQDALVFENKHQKGQQHNLTEPHTKTPESQGLGQGLYLVKRIAAGLDWQLKVQTIEQSFKVILLPKGLSNTKSTK